MNFSSGRWICFSGSLGDLYLLASVLLSSPLFTIYDFKLIASHRQYDLLRVFVGIKWIQAHVVFVDHERLDLLRQQHVTNKWRHYNIQFATPDVWPKDIFFSNLIIDNPLVLRLVYEGIISTTQASGLFFGINPSDCRATLPMYYSSSDRQQVSDLLSSLHSLSQTCLYHPVNHTFKPLDLPDLQILFSTLRDYGVNLVFNTSQSDPGVSKLCNEFGSCIELPSHLMPLVYSKFSSVAGISGGGITIASIFSSTNICQGFSGVKHHSYVVNRITDMCLSRGIVDTSGLDFYGAYSDLSHHRKRLNYDGRTNFDCKVFAHMISSITL